MNEPVLDASAVLALLNREPGHAAVAAVLPAALLGAVNLAEILSKLCERGVPTETAMEAVQCLGVEIVPLTPALALRIAALRPLTRAFGLSLGDRACLALGQERAAIVLTAERHWDARVEAAAELRIQRIRPAA